MKTFGYFDGLEHNAIFFSSSAKTPEEAMETITATTAGNCLGPIDMEEDETYSIFFALVKDNFKDADEMSKAETDARIAHLAEEWGLPLAELEYLR